MRRMGLLLASMLACGAAGAAAETGYTWMGGSGDGNFSLIYGSPETAEDELFWIVCRNGDKKTELVVYVDMKDVKLGQPVAIEFSAGNTIKKVIELLAAKGTVTVTTGTIVTKLPDKGRGPELAKFAKGCKLN